MQIDTVDNASLQSLQFTFVELLSFIGLIQCTFILVYILSRSGDILRAILPFLYFLLLAISFFMDFSMRYIGGVWPYFDVFKLTLWFSAPVISPLVIIQIIQITRFPDLKYFTILLLPFCAFLLSAILGVGLDGCSTILECDSFFGWLVISFTAAAEISFLILWFRRDLFEDLKSDKHGKERYWVVLMMVMANLGLLLLTFGYINQALMPDTLEIIRTILGLTLVYLVMTSLFRIYPQPIRLIARRVDGQELSENELALAKKIENLMLFEKVYQEPGYNRRDLAFELNESELIISKIINNHFDKSLPQLLNDYRVNDAKQLLLETDANISLIVDEVGFNSVATFNRVFKESQGMSPREYRKSKIK